MLPSLVDVSEEDPVVEAATLSTLAARFRHDFLPAHVMDRGKSMEYFQHVGQFRGQFRGQFPVRRCLHFMRLLQQLRPQSRHILALDNAMARLGGHEVDHLNGRLYVSRMREGTRPIPVAGYRGTGHAWAYPTQPGAAERRPARAGARRLHAGYPGSAPL